MLVTGGGPNFLFVGPGMPGGGPVTASVANGFAVMPAPTAVGFPINGAFAVPVPGPGVVVAPEIVKRLGEMQREIDELRHAVETLRGKAQRAAFAEVGVAGERPYSSRSA